MLKKLVTRALSALMLVVGGFSFSANAAADAPSPTTLVQAEASDVGEMGNSRYLADFEEVTLTDRIDYGNSSGPIR